MRVCLSCAGLTAASALLFLISAPHSARALTYEEALLAAEAEAPQIRARREAIAGAEASRVSAARLPDPKLFAAIENYPVSGSMRYSLTDDFMTMQTIGVMQDVPNGDKLAARQSLADAMAARRWNDLAADRLMVQREAAAAWIARYTVERKLGTLPEFDREIQILAEVVRAQLAAGMASPADTLSVKGETAALADRRDSFQRELTQARAALVRWVGPRGNEPLSGGPPELSVDSGKLREKLGEQPELTGYSLLLRTAMAEVRMAQAMTKFDWSVQFAYQRRAPEFGYMVSLMFTFDLPLFTKYRQEPDIAARLAETRDIQEELSAAERQRLEELERMLAERSELERRRARLRTEWIPLARQRVELTLASYRAGRGDLNDVLVARRTSIESRLNLIEVDGEFLRNSASLAYLLPENQR